jgi:hypothetical protein
VMLRVPVLLIVAELDIAAGRPTSKSDSTVIVPLLLRFRSWRNCWGLLSW